MKFPKNEKGFTLIETLVAIVIFASAITALISITAGGISNTNFVKNKFTAGYLALEGAELIHNIRDTVSITDSSAGWGATTSALTSCMEPSACWIDVWGTNSPASCGSSEDCPAMDYNRQSGKFNYAGSDGQNNLQSIFTRIISIKIVSDSEIRVTSKVYWLQGTQLHTVSYSYDLLNWTSP